MRAERLPSYVVRDEDSLRRAVDVLRIQSGLPLVVQPAAEGAALEAGASFDFNLTEPLLVRDVLNLIAQAAGDEVGWTIRHDVLLFTTRAALQGRLALVAHDVRALTIGKVDFIGPRIDRLRLLDELEDDDGGGPFGAEGERRVGMQAEDVATLVQESIAAGTWEDEGVSIETQNGFLWVRHRADVQRKIAAFLAGLGA